MYGCGNVATVFLSCMRSAMQLHPAGRRPTAKGEKRKAGRRERIQHKRLQYTGSRTPVQLQRSTYQRRCNGVDVTRRCRRGTAARYVKVGHPACTTALPPPPMLLVSCRWCYLPCAITVRLMATSIVHLNNLYKTTE